MTAPWQQSFKDLDFSGDDAQNVVGNVVGGDVIQHVQKFMRGRPALFLGPSEVVDRVNCHVPAPNHDLVVKALEADRAALLGGPPGSGRETAAIAAMSELRPDIPIRRFASDMEDSEEIRAAGPCGYLVRAADEKSEGLVRCLDAAHAAGGYVAIIGDEDQRLRLNLPVPFIEVEPPDAVDVYRHRLTVRGYAGPGWARWTQARALLERARPAGARRLADIVEDVTSRGGDLTAMQAEVVQAYRGWGQELRQWFLTNPEPQDRALMISAATLQPATDIDVYAAALALARQLRTEVNGSGLAWSPAAGLRDLLEADSEDGRIVFRRHGFARSVLRHVWDDYPLTRPDLMSWLSDLVLDANTASAQRTLIAEVFADLAAADGLYDRILTAAQSWAEAELSGPAYILLSQTCLHSRVGGKIRRGLYDWAYKARTDQTLKLTIARVCEPLGQAYPSIALTRLKHLATHGNGQVRQEVVGAARSLAQAGQRRAVIDAALDWSGEHGRVSVAARRRRMRTGAIIFLDLAADVTQAGVPEILVHRPVHEFAPAWGAALSADPVLDVGGVFGLWLDTALHHAHVRSEIVRVLIDAGRPVPDRVIDLARHWAAADPGDRTRRRIRDEIVVALTQTWWLRLLRILMIWARDRVTAPRRAS
ncbi:hypothetical protein [Spirillospora sp. NBC_01491]|uniref:hypothetical protein n=1 Tax=Spirillospora sp. NBC_01491 TaxID=2976007 RepID=UPI002E362E96|nr:hypothetical protein [Spirillospora sp. NBC_01491]